MLTIGIVLLIISLAFIMFIMNECRTSIGVGTIFCFMATLIASTLIYAGLERKTISKQFDCKILEERDGIYRIATSSDEIKYIGYAVVVKTMKW